MSTIVGICIVICFCSMIRIASQLRAQVASRSSGTHHTPRCGDEASSFSGFYDAGDVSPVHMAEYAAAHGVTPDHDYSNDASMLVYGNSIHGHDLSQP